MEKRTNKKVTKEDLELVQTLDNAGLSKAKIKKITGRSLTVIMLLKQSKDMRDYKRISQAYWEEKMAKTAERKAKGRPVDAERTNGETKYVTDERAEVMKELLKEVTKLNKNVETLGNFLVETVNKQRLEKKGFFKIR